MDQSNDVDKAMREATRGLVEYMQTGRAPLLSICDDGPLIEQLCHRALSLPPIRLLAEDFLHQGDELGAIERVLRGVPPQTHAWESGEHPPQA